MPGPHGTSWPSAIFMSLSFFGILLGYWKIIEIFSFASSVLADSLGPAIPQISGTSQALNPFQRNTIANESLTLFYNGSGPVPGYDELSPDPIPITPFKNVDLIESAFFKEFVAISTGDDFPDQCSKCVASLEILHLAAITQPVSMVTSLLIKMCKAVPFFRNQIYASSCESEFSGVGNLGPYLAQLFSKMSLATGDMKAMCFYKYKVCEPTPAIGIDESLYFKPKPESANRPVEPSGKTINVLHLTDWHLDPRYDIGSEANCSTYMCCRPFSTNTDFHTTAKNASLPASRFGSYYCDSPPDLALSAFTTMSQFFNPDDVAFTIFTGDIVSHDQNDHLSHAYVSYEEEITFKVFKTMLGDIPVYPALGNHDTLPIAFNAPNTLNPDQRNLSSNPMSWNYELLSSLWSEYSWLNETEAEMVTTHFGGYAANTKQGLRIISINADFWYNANMFNYFDFKNPDPSGILKWLADELSACESRGQRAWIIAHVHSGYDGEGGLPNPTALFHSIVRRFSPATIAGIFFGHTHQDQFQIFYDFLPDSVSVDKHGRHLRDTSKVDYSKPIQLASIGPSITPLTGYNAGYQLFEIDAVTFSIIGMKTYIANMSNSLDWTTPEWQFEYDAREAYADSSWPTDAPLNASFFHDLTERMLKNHTLVDMYNKFETKSSSAPRNRGGPPAGPEELVCYLRSGNGELGTRCRAKHRPGELYLT